MPRLCKPTRRARRSFWVPAKPWASGAPAHRRPPAGTPGTRLCQTATTRPPRPDFTEIRACCKPGSFWAQQHQQVTTALQTAKTSGTAVPGFIAMRIVVGFDLAGIRLCVVDQLSRVDFAHETLSTREKYNTGSSRRQILFAAASFCLHPQEAMCPSRSFTPPICI